MPRKPRIVAAGVPHHVTARGNNRQDVFFSSQDREIYLQVLQKHAERRGVRLWGYCLMTNHVHLIAVPETQSSLAITSAGTHSEYSRFINTVYGRCGHLWQRRYHSCPMDSLYAFRALAYVECNPVRAGIVDNPASYPWSSASAHCHGGRSRIELEDEEWAAAYTPRRWRAVLASGVSGEAFAERLREATARGFTMGAPTFIDNLGEQLGRNLHRVPVGRPRKRASAAA